MDKRFDPLKKRPAGDAPRGKDIEVRQETTLLPFLLDVLKGRSRSSVKSLLGHGLVSVNRGVATRSHTPLKPGDVVTIGQGRGKTALGNRLLNIVYEDDSVIVVNKREGLLSVSTARVRERTAYHILDDYLKKSGPGNRVFVLHRLDRETSGLMMFAKTRAVQEKMQRDWNGMIVERAYVAVVEGCPEKESGVLVTNLRENAAARVYVVGEGGKEAVTRYRVLDACGRYALLELSLETGRKNQIRAQLEYIGHPVAGDYKYGAETDPAGRLMLHARRLHFIHPETGEVMRFDTRIPDSFRSLTSKKR